MRWQSKVLIYMWGYELWMYKVNWWIQTEKLLKDKNVSAVTSIATNVNWSVQRSTIHS